MTRRLSLAMALSAAIHVAAIVLLDHFILRESTPANVDTPLIVSISSPVLSNELSPPDSMPLAVDPNPPEIPYPAPAVEVSEMPGAMASLSDEPEMPARLAEDAPANWYLAAATAESSLTEQGAPLPSDPVSAVSGPVLVTHGPDAEWSVPTKAAIATKQKKMLDRKVKEWTEELYEVHDLAAGETWHYKGQEYTARFSELSVDNEMGIERIQVEVSTVENGERLVTELQLKRLAFSSFAQFVNRWDPDVQMHDDEIDGRFHANSKINLTYDRSARPIFHSKVTTTAHRIEMTQSRGLRRRDQIFLGGLETGVRSIPLPRQSTSFPGLLQDGDLNVHRLTVDTRITFRADGSYVWQAVESGSAVRTGRLSAGTTYFIGDEDAAIHVRGVVNGKVLVYSPVRIVIEDDLVYQQDPEADPASDDFLGLVSDRHVYVATPDLTGPGDLSVHAAIFARRRFGIRGVNVGERALLRLYGSLSAGSLSATEPRYATKIRFDRRLENMRPPGFPTTNRYEVEAWEADWTVQSVR